MGKVIALEEYRALKALREREQTPPARRPRIRDGDIWAGNYSEFDGVVYGIIMIRQVLDYHLHYSEEWKYYLLCLLDNAHGIRAGQGPERLRETAEILKSYVAEEINETNRKDMTIVLLLLDLIAKGASEQYSALR